MSDINPFRILGIQFGSDEEVKSAYERMRRIFNEGSSLVIGLYTEQYRREYLYLVEKAFLELTNMEKRQEKLRQYKQELDADPLHRQIVTTQRPRSKSSDDESLEPRKRLDELSITIDDQTVFSGATLKAIREEMGIRLSAIAQTTKISSSNLKMMEEDQYKNLPASVYVRGFLREYALYLGLDPHQVLESYLQLMRESQED